MADSTSTGTGKILIVDDDQALRQLYSVELSSRGFTTAEGIDGEDGLIKIKSEKPNLVLLDIMMPKIDGIALLTKIKDDPEISQIPLIILSNFGQESLIKQAYTLGVTDYLLKYKVTPSEMADKVIQTLSAKPVEL